MPAPHDSYNLNDFTVDPVRHAYRWKGQLLPGVTTILRAGGWHPDFTRLPDAVRQRALARGTAVHAAAHQRDLGVPQDIGLVTEDTVDYLAADEKLRRALGFTPIETELAVVHPTLKYAGRLDTIGWYRGKRVLADRKTGGSVPPWAWLQLQLYRLAWEFWHPDQRVDFTAVFLLRPSTDPVMVTDPHPAFSAQVALAALWRYKWLTLHPHSL